MGTQEQKIEKILKMEEGNISDYEVDGHQMHIIKSNDKNGYEIHTMGYGEFTQREFFKKAEELLQKEASYFGDDKISACSDNETSLYLKMEFSFKRESLYEKVIEIEGAIRELNRVFDSCKGFWELCSESRK